MLKDIESTLGSDKSRVPTNLSVKGENMRLISGVAGLALLCCTANALANGYGEDSSWQFETSADQANMAAVQNMIQQKKAGMYQAPNYNTTNVTNIGKQYNCGVYATSYGNYGTNTQGGNSPSTTGASASSSGNSSSSTVGQDGPTTGPINVSAGQSNTGTVNSGVNGGTYVSAGGPVNQNLNSRQSNSGRQVASVSNSTACSGALN